MVCLMEVREDYFCPLCNADLRAAPIPQESIDKGYYGDPNDPNTPKWFSHKIGHEISGIYDGVLFWSCPFCGGAWHRWTDARMRAKAHPHIDRMNAERGQ